jgi:hypothetical protein
MTVPCSATGSGAGYDDARASAAEPSRISLPMSRL